MVVVGVENVVVESFKFADLVFNAVSDAIDRVTGASDCFQVVTQDGEELLQHHAGVVEVTEDNEHVFRARKDLLDREFPAVNRYFGLDVHLRLIELVLPLLKHSNALLDDID